MMPDTAPSGCATKAAKQRGSAGPCLRSREVRALTKRRPSARYAAPLEPSPFFLPQVRTTCCDADVSGNDQSYAEGSLREACLAFSPSREKGLAMPALTLGTTTRRRHPLSASAFTTWSTNSASCVARCENSLCYRAGMMLHACVATRVSERGPMLRGQILVPSQYDWSQSEGRPIHYGEARYRHWQVNKAHRAGWGSRKVQRHQRRRAARQQRPDHRRVVGTQLGLPQLQPLCAAGQQRRRPRPPVRRPQWRRPGRPAQPVERRAPLGCRDACVPAPNRKESVSSQSQPEAGGRR
jgi:hypothetical protein